MVDTAIPSQESPVPAQNIDIEDTSDLQWIPPQGSLRVPTIPGDTIKNSIPKALLNAVVAVADQPALTQLKRGDRLLDEACEIMDKLELESAIEGGDLRTFDDKILR